MQTINNIMKVQKNRKDKNIGIINFSNELILKNIKEIDKKLKKSCKDFKQLQIKIKNVDSMDISFIQLLLSIKNQVKNIEADIPENISSIIIKAGLNEILMANNK